jgi:uncharacterized membrane protein
MTEIAKEESTTRLEAISDGVFAVALTLLVLDIHVPQSDRGHLAGELLARLPHLFAFALSFLIVAFYWTAHHVLFNSIRRSNRLLLWVNCSHLFFVVLLPFSTGVLAEYRSEPIAVVVYGVNVIMCSLTLIALWIYVARNGLIVAHLSERSVRIVVYRLSVNPIVCVIALCVAFVSPHAATLLYLVTPIWYVFTGPAAAAGDSGFWPLQWRGKARNPRAGR